MRTFVFLCKLDGMFYQTRPLTIATYVGAFDFFNFETVSITVKKRGHATTFVRVLVRVRWSVVIIAVGNSCFTFTNGDQDKNNSTFLSKLALSRLLGYSCSPTKRLDTSKADADQTPPTPDPAK